MTHPHPFEQIGTVAERVVKRIADRLTIENLDAELVAAGNAWAEAAHSGTEAELQIACERYGEAIDAYRNAIGVK